MASGAVGSLRKEFKPRDLVIPDQVIDKTSRGPGRSLRRRRCMWNLPNRSARCCGKCLLQDAAKKAETAQAAAALPAVHGHGCYVCMEGPAFSTRAESLMHRLWGGDLIGMTAMPEAKLAREAEITYALVALVTDYDCWKPQYAAARGRKQPGPPPPPHGAGTAEGDHRQRAVGIAQCDDADSPGAQENRGRTNGAKTQPGPQALELAIWTDKSKIVGGRNPAAFAPMGPLFRE